MKITCEMLGRPSYHDWKEDIGTNEDIILPDGFCLQDYESFIVKTMMEKSKISKNKLAKCLGVDLETFDNKLNNSNFSITDLVRISCECHIALHFDISTKMRKEDHLFEIGRFTMPMLYARFEEE